MRSEAHSFRRSSAEVPNRGGEGERKPPTINATKLMRDWLAATSATALEEFAASLGVKVTLCEAVPALGAVAGAVKVKLPGTDPTPPLKVELASVCPKVIALALGGVVMVANALDTT